MESERHREQMHLLIDTLQDAWRDRRDFYVSGNMAVYFSETQAKKQDFRAPDFFLVLDVERRERKGWVVWEEDGRSPDVVIELISESTEAADRGRKKQIYERALRVPFYGIYDPLSARFDAYELGADRVYHALAPDEHGRVWCAPVGMYLGIHSLAWKHLPGPWLRWIDRDGKPLTDARAHAEEAETRARDAEDRLRRAEEELARLRDELARRGG